MNILELCLSPGLGGLELYAFRSAKALDNKNHHVLTVLDKSGKLTGHFKDHSDIKTTYIKYSPAYLPIFNARRLAKIIDTNNIDVIHMHWGNDLALATLAKRMSQHKPALIYTRQMQITRSKNNLYHNFLYQQMDLMLTITKQLENNARGFISKFADRITTLYYGVGKPDHILTQLERNTQRQELGLTDNDFVVGLFGRLEVNKGQYLLIEAIAIANNNDVPIKALVVGHEMKKGYRNEIKLIAKKLGVRKKVIFHDFVNNPQSLMQICNCVALTTYEETFGLVLPEAMRAGIAVIGSNRGGVLEIIDHKKTGLLFESGNSDNLYEQIISLYENPDFRKNLAENGKMKADTLFNDVTHMSKLEQHLMSTLQK